MEFGAIAAIGVNTGAFGVETGDIREELGPLGWRLWALGAIGVEIWGHCGGDW